MDTVGQHTSTHTHCVYLGKGGPSIEGLTQLLEMCLSVAHLPSNTKISYKRQIIYITF